MTRELGAGGMGKVYVAEHVLLGKEVALKILLPEMTVHPEMFQRFFNEAKAAAKIRHSTVVDVFDFGEENGRSYFAMELLDGESLGSRLRRVGHLSVDLALAIGKQITDGLAEAHAKGIVHRDLKPDNLFLTPNPEMRGGVAVRILDFGIAKLQEDAGLRTKTNMAIGTPAYMSPEQARGAGRSDARSDVYSLGCILYEMMAGRTPFVCEGTGDYFYAHRVEPPPSLRGFVPGIPARVEEIVMRCLEKEPARRFQTMGELGAALAEVLAATPPIAAEPTPAVLPTPALSAPPVSQDPARPQRPDAIRAAAPPTTMGGAASETVARAPRRRLLLGAGVVVGTAAIVVAVVLAFNHSGSRRPGPPEPVMSAPSPSMGITASPSVAADAGAVTPVHAATVERPDPPGTTGPGAMPDAGAPARASVKRDERDHRRPPKPERTSAEAGKSEPAPPAPTPAKADAGTPRASGVREGTLVKPEGFE